MGVFTSGLAEGFTEKVWSLWLCYLHSSLSVDAVRRSGVQCMSESSYGYNPALNRWHTAASWCALALFSHIFSVHLYCMCVFQQVKSSRTQRCLDSTHCRWTASKIFMSVLKLQWLRARSSPCTRQRTLPGLDKRSVLKQDDNSRFVQKAFDWHFQKLYNMN